jgi:hypothetical protein
MMITTIFHDYPLLVMMMMMMIFYTINATGPIILYWRLYINYVYIYMSLLCMCSICTRCRLFFLNSCCSFLRCKFRFPLSVPTNYVISQCSHPFIHFIRAFKYSCLCFPTIIYLLVYFILFYLLIYHTLSDIIQIKKANLARSKH